MALQTIVNANITIAGAAPAAQPLDIEILGATLTAPQGTAWTAAFGSNLIVEVANDTWQDTLATIGITDGEGVYEYLQLTFSSSPFPRLVQIGRRAAPVPQVTNFDLGDAGAAADGLYRLTLQGTNFDVNAVAQTRAQVVTSMIALVDADPRFGAVVGGDTEQLDVTAAEAGAPFNFATSAPSPDLWLTNTTTPNAGLTTDVDLWEAERKVRGLGAFYLPTIPEAVSFALAQAAAEHAASFARDIAYWLRTDSATDPDAATGGGIAETLAPFNYARLVVTNVPTATNYHWARLLGDRLTATPGSKSWGNVQLSGVQAPLHTSTEDNVLIAAPYAYFDRIDSLGVDISISRNARVIDGTNFHVIRGADFLKASVIADVFALLIREDVIPFTVGGYGDIGGVIGTALARFVSSGFIPAFKADGTPGYSVTIPAVPPPGDADRVAGIARGFSFTALLAGSIERVFPIDGLLIQ